MEKILVAVAMLVFSQNPLLAYLDERLEDYLGFVGQIAPSSMHQQGLSIDTQIDRLGTVDTKTFMDKIDLLPVALNSEINSGSGSNILDLQADVSVLQMSHGNVQDRHESIRHHLDPTASGIGRDSSQDDPNSRQKNTERAYKTNDVVQAVTLSRNSVADAHRSSVSPLSTEVRNIDIVWLSIAILSSCYGTLFAVLLLGYQRAIFSRWWYVDALICEIIGLLGLCALPGLI